MEHNRPVYVDLRHEPENPYNENAIAVYLQNDDIFEHVRYIYSTRIDTICAATLE